MPRLFSGIEIPRDIADRLALLGAPINGARWIPPEDMHLTLYFAGDIAEDIAEDWANRLAAIEFTPFDIVITGLGVFGKSRPRTIWAAIAPNDLLMQLQNAHRLAARQAGIAPEANPFIPHITLARCKGCSSEAVASCLAAHDSFESKTFIAERAVLFSARPRRGGGPYHVEDVYPFTPSRPSRLTPSNNS